MTGAQYEQIVRSVLARKLAIPPDELRSGREPGAVLPDGPAVLHQVDLIYTDKTAVADYITVIECKYRSTAPVDQEEVAKLAFVKGSMRASKAILVTNTEFTRGAQALADAEKIALLIVRAGIDAAALSAVPTAGDADSIFQAVEDVLARTKARSEVIVVRRFASEPGSGRDLIGTLAADPEVRAMAEKALRDPAIRNEVEQTLRANPDLARKAMDFLKGRGF
jgi:hypothetical protein